MYADQDGAEPTSNSYSAFNLQRLSAYFPGKVIGPKSTDIYKAFGEMLGEHPIALPKMVSAFIFHSQTPKQVSFVKLFGERSMPSHGSLMESFVLLCMAVYIYVFTVQPPVNDVNG